MGGKQISESAEQTDFEICFFFHSS